MPPHLATTAAGGFGKRRPTMPAYPRYDHCDLIHLLRGQYSPEGPVVAWLPAPLRPDRNTGQFRRF